jgi:phosphotransacetylase
MNSRVESERDPKQSILLPETTGSLAVQAFQVMNADQQLPVVFQDMPLDQALDMLGNEEVAGVLAGAAHTTGQVISHGIAKFNPRRNEAGEEDPNGVRARVSSFFVFERQGDTPFIIGDCAVNEAPEQLQLLEIAEQTVENARRLDIDPHVAFLSYSTTGSGHGESSSKVRAVAKMFKDKHQDIPTIGEVQFDAATDERIYRLKTQQDWPGTVAPNVFIAPNLDTGNNIYKVLQSRQFGGGWTAVGPLLQGFENGRQLHDLSRGVTPEALAVICRYVAKLSGIKLVTPDIEPETPEASST